MTAIVFLGPSLPVAEARQLLPDATYLPPVGQSDLLSVARTFTPEAIAIVDGVFHHAQPVWHREILDALAQGIRVYGASSMGALRAAECDSFGMVGVGEIYQAYAAGRLTDDDEVAVAHLDADYGWRPASIPMVNVRPTLAAAVDGGLLDQHWHVPILRGVKELWFPERTVAAICQIGEGLGMGEDELEALQRIFRDHLVDLKAADTRLLLERLAADAGSPAPERDWVLNRPMVYESLVERDRWVTHPTGTARMEQIAQHHALNRPDGQRVIEDAMNRGVALALAEMLGFEPDAETIRAELFRLCRRRRLRVGEIAGWLTRNDLAPADLPRLLREEATLRHLRGWLQHRYWLSGAIGSTLDHLRLRGEYEEWTARTTAAQSLLTACRPDPAQPRPPFGVNELIMDHAAATGVAPDAALDEWAFSMGFSTAEDVVQALYEQRIVRQAATGTHHQRSEHRNDRA